MRASEASVAGLVAAARSGDRAVRDGAWHELVRRFDGMARAVAAGFGLQRADADDVVQATWLLALEQLATLREPQRFGGWLRSIARNECLDACARAGRERPVDGVGAAVEEPSPGPEALAVRGETVRALREAVAALPSRNRCLVESLFFAEADYATITRETGMPSGGIGPTRARALLRLRDRLARHGHGPDAALARAG